MSRSTNEPRVDELAVSKAKPPVVAHVTEGLSRPEGPMEPGLASVMTAPSRRGYSPSWTSLLRANAPIRLAGCRHASLDRDERLTPGRLGVQDLARDLGDVGDADESQRAAQLTDEQVERSLHAGFSAGAEAVEVGTTDHHRAGTEGERLHHVAAPAYPAVLDDLGPVA